MAKIATQTTKTMGSREARKRLSQRKEPYFMELGNGLLLGYYKGKKGGTWKARAPQTDSSKSSFYADSKLGHADDAGEGLGLSCQQAQAAALEWFKGAYKQRKAGEEDHSGKTVADCVEPYIRHLCRKRQLAPDSVEAKQKMAHTRAAITAHILPTLGSTRLADVQHAKLVSWRDALADAQARVRSKNGAQAAFRTVDASDADAVRKRQATANRVLTILKAMLNHARGQLRWMKSDDEWRFVKPFGKVDVPKVRFLTGAEVISLVECCQPDFRKLVQAALMTGTRYGELTALKSQHVDLQEGHIYIEKSKNGEARYVHLNDEGINLFASLAANSNSQDALFLKANGKPWMKSEQKRPMDKACETAGVEDVTFHILRHTYASHAMMNGMPLEVLQKQLGHADLRMTMRHYAHLCDTYKQKSVRANAPSFGFPDPHGLTLVTDSYKIA
jgi:integrase